MKKQKGPLFFLLIVFSVFSILLIWFSAVFVVHAKPQKGSITGVVVESRRDSDRQQTLLVEVKGEKSAKVDEVRLKLSKKFLKSVSASSLPFQWGFKVNKKYILISGAEMELPIYLRLDLGKISPPGKTDVEIYHKGKLRYRKKGIIIKPRPPVQVSSDCSSIVTFPSVVSPGDLIELKPLNVKETPLGGTWKIAEQSAEYIKEKEYYRVTLPETLAANSPISLSYTDPYGVELYQTQKLPDVNINPSTKTITPAINSVSPIVFVGDLICICGNFPNMDSRYGLRLDDSKLVDLVSSSSKVVAYRLPADLEPGKHSIAGDQEIGFEPDVVKEFEAIRISGSIDRDKLLLGDSTPLHLMIEGTEKALSLNLTNETPNIVSLEGGNKQVLFTSGGKNNRIEKMVHSVSPGDFKLNYELDLDFCPCYEEIDYKKAGCKEGDTRFIGEIKEEKWIIPGRLSVEAKPQVPRGVDMDGAQEFFSSLSNFYGSAKWGSMGLSLSRVLNSSSGPFAVGEQGAKIAALTAKKGKEWADKNARKIMDVKVTIRRFEVITKCRMKQVCAEGGWVNIGFEEISESEKVFRPYMVTRQGITAREIERVVRKARSAMTRLYLDQEAYDKDHCGKLNKKISKPTGGTKIEDKDQIRKNCQPILDKIDKAIEDLEEVNDQIEKQESDLKELEAKEAEERKKLEDKIKEAEKKVEELSKKLGKLEYKEKQYEQNQPEQHEQLIRWIRTIRRLRGEIEKTKKSLKNAQKELKSVKIYPDILFEIWEEKEKAQRKIKNLNEEADRLEAEISRLREEYRKCMGQ